jgi:hypothetical protein
MAEISNRASGPLSVALNEIIHSASWQPWQKSAIVPAALLQSDWNTSSSQIGTPIYFAALLLFNSLTASDSEFPLFIRMCRRL